MGVRVFFGPAASSDCDRLGGNDKPVSSSFAIENQKVQESEEHLEIDLNYSHLSGFDSAESIMMRLQTALRQLGQRLRMRHPSWDRSIPAEGRLAFDYLYSKNGTWFLFG